MDQFFFPTCLSEEHLQYFLITIFTNWQIIHEYDHQNGKIWGLVNIAHELGQNVHEQCSPKSLKGGFVNSVHEFWQTVQEQCSSLESLNGYGEHCSRTLTKCSRTIFNKMSKKGVWLMVNTAHEIWQKFHEKCSPEPIW